MSNRLPRPRHAPAAFTLVEVMISIALVLIIILGVNQVFALTSQVVGAGSVLSTITRDARGAQSVLQRDLGNAEVTRGPFFIINSQALAAFRNRDDQLADIDFDVTDRNEVDTDQRIRTVDRDENGVETAAERTSRAFMTSRVHRADQLVFFARQPARRQTGNVNTFTSGVRSNELYISYGHLRQPRDDGLLGNAPFPGIHNPASATACETPSTNPNNYYATQWVLGRSAMLLQEPEVAGGAQRIYDRSITPIRQMTYVGRDPTVGPESVQPFAAGSLMTQTGPVDNSANAPELDWSVYDLIGMSMERYRSELLPPAIAAGGVWHNPLVFRFAGFPVPTKPLSSEGVARTVPCLVRGCTQFAVEFAGDFIAQDANGNRTGVANNSGGGTDGEIDFIVQTYLLNNVTQTARRIRWYGFPRDTSGALNATISGESPAERETRLQNADKPDGFVYAEDDVVPLRDIAGQTLKFERYWPTAAPPPNRSGPGIPRPSSPDYSVTDPADAVPANGRYRCVWATDTSGLPEPKLIRITMAIDDPSARIAREQYFEYVIELPKK